VVMVDEHAVDIPPAQHMIVVRNEDTPGVIGLVGTILGDAGVNVSDMAVGQSSDGVAALMVAVVDQPVDHDVVAQLSARPGIKSVAVVNT